MGKRGPKPEPTALKKLRGNPGKRALNRNEPQPAVGAKPPRWVNAKSRYHWRKVAPELERLGILTVVDTVAFGLLCDALVDYVLAREVVEAAAEEGGVRFVATTDKGNIIQHPAVGVMNKAWERVLKACREFGMTPSSRTSLQTESGDAADDPLFKLLRGRGMGN